MATQSSIFAQRISWTEEGSGGLLPTGLLYILDIDPLLDVLFANIFSEPVGCLFTVDCFLCCEKALQVYVVHNVSAYLESTFYET